MDNNVKKVIVLKGIPGSSKSTYCKEVMAKEPGQWKRINNDSLRESFDFSEYSPENEKVITAARKYLLREFLKSGYNVFIDNVHASSKEHFDEVCKVVKTLNMDVEVSEKPFYISYEEAVERDSKREGKARVGEEVIKKFWNKLNREQFQNYVPKVETFYQTTANDKIWQLLKQDESLPKAVICDLDGTLTLFNDKRSPYDASNCDIVDDLNPATAEAVKLYYNAGYKIIFCTGRMAKDEAPTCRFIEKHLPGIEYQIFTRQNDDFRPDDQIKEEIFNTHIKDKYYVHAVYDDRLSVCRLWHRIGLHLFRVGDPDSNF